MREYFPTKGTRGLDMMRRTATVQVNLDYVDEQDAMRKLQLGLKLAPVATAIFANSPFSEGRIHANKTERGAVWLDADPDRTGLLPQMWAPKAGFRDYVEWALDVPMYMFKRPGPTGEPTAVINTGQPFRSFWQDGYEGHRATLEDWHTHLATLFPEARLKSTVELRSADSLPQPLLCALPAFWAGLLYDQTALTAAEELVADWTFEQVQAARPDIARRAVAVKVQAHLANGDHSGMSSQVPQFNQCGVVSGFRIVRVKAHGCKDPLVGLGQRHSGTTGLQVYADGDNGYQASLPGAIQHGVPVVVELSKVQMGVGINQHYFNPAMRIPASRMAGTFAWCVVSQ